MILSPLISHNRTVMRLAAAHWHDPRLALWMDGWLALACLKKKERKEGGAKRFEVKKEGEKLTREKRVGERFLHFLPPLCHPPTPPLFAPIFVEPSRRAALCHRGAPAARGQVVCFFVFCLFEVVFHLRNSEKSGRRLKSGATTQRS